MTIKVIGASFGRTGTLSLKVALEELGFSKCYHMLELLQHPQQVTFWEEASQGKSIDWDTVFEGYQATVDFPGYRYYRQLMERYPDAKVLLSVRDPNAWYESTLNTIYQAGPSGRQKLLMVLKLPFSSKLRQLIRVFRLANQDVWQGEFQGKFTNKSFALEVFHQHIEEVKRVVPPERLLVYQVQEGWEPLCRFLGVPIPEHQPFPRLNDRAAFEQMSKQLLTW